MSIADSMRVNGPDNAPVDLIVADVADGSLLVRDGARLRAPKPFPVATATFTWQTDDLELWITYAAGSCNVTLPPSSDITSWPPGTAMLRRIRKFNVSANGIVLTPQSGCSINGGAVATAMNPIPGTNVTPSLTVTMPSVSLYRVTATQFYVLAE